MADPSKSSSYNSQKATAADLSILEKLDTIPAVVSLLANVFTAIFTRPLRSKDNRPESYYRYVGLTAIRTLTRRLSVRQQHYMTPTTDEGYLAACKKRKFTPNSEVLEDGTRAHWVGSSEAEKVILNFHGGGYVFPAGPEMYEFMFQIVDVLKEQGKSVSVLMLSYDLAPGEIYPRQLQQASLLLKHVVDTLSVPPSSILLTGDSAGANLALSLLSHISHPHPNPSIPRIKLETPLRGAVLISPWVSFSTSTPSYTINKYKDCLDPRAVTQWSEAFRGRSAVTGTLNTTDYYSEAITAPESWWEGLGVEEVLIVAGAEEVLIDGIKEFEGKFRRGVGEGTKVELVVADGEYHDQPSLDMQLGYGLKDEGVQAKRIKGWIKSKL